MAPVGLCGLGQMGAAVAERLANAHRVVAHDPDPERRELVASQPEITTADSVGALADLPVVVLSLPRPEVSRAVCRELAASLRPGSTVVETSTVLPGDALDCARDLAEAGVHYLDAAILSGVGQMRDGRATLLVGPPSAGEQAEAVLATLGASVERFGGVGAGMAAKVINNQVAHAVMVVLAEATALASASGVGLERMVDLLAKPDGGLRRPLTHRVAERVAHSDYDGGMPTDAARKDSVLALEMAQQLGVPLFATQAAHTVYDLAVAAGLGRDDYAAVATLWEQWTGVSFGD
ncbi:NAD(P)-dependent oxidoreductase [Saccharomonospora piscinae]|uniref:NAD(P)-dependent oxidoreductase n=1 Tax=Saccharomonospora piscinae TaxID=687388 RepID=UPI00056BE538|nr:NAD(P)-dependent oxidoreductase [Saccharomonospora piscinae]